MLRTLSSAATSGAAAAAINTATVTAPTNTLIRIPRPFFGSRQPRRRQEIQPGDGGKVNPHRRDSPGDLIAARAASARSLPLRPCDPPGGPDLDRAADCPS